MSQTNVNTRDKGFEAKVTEKPVQVNINMAMQVTDKIADALIEQYANDSLGSSRWTCEKWNADQLVMVALLDAAKMIIKYVPPSADRSAALRKLREVRMDCMSAIKHDGKY